MGQKNLSRGSLFGIMRLAKDFPSHPHTNNRFFFFQKIPHFLYFKKGFLKFLNMLGCVFFNYSLLSRGLFGVCFYLPVISYDHVETVSLPHHNFSWASLSKLLTNCYFVHIFSLVTNKSPS